MFLFSIAVELVGLSGLEGTGATFAVMVTLLVGDLGESLSQSGAGV